MQKPQLDPDVADTAPSDPVLTTYDHEHMVTYMRVFDALCVVVRRLLTWSPREACSASGSAALRIAIAGLRRSGRSQSARTARDSGCQAAVASSFLDSAGSFFLRTRAALTTRAISVGRRPPWDSCEDMI
jgi:hypothetical protein